MSFIGVTLDQYGLCETINPETGLLELRTASEVDEEGRRKLMEMPLNEDGTRGEQHYQVPWEREKWDRDGKVAAAEARSDYESDDTIPDAELMAKQGMKWDAKRKNYVPTHVFENKPDPYPIVKWDEKEGRHVTMIRKRNASDNTGKKN